MKMHAEPGGTKRQHLYSVTATFLTTFTSDSIAHNNRHIQGLHIMTATYSSRSTAIFTPEQSDIY